MAAARLRVAATRHYACTWPLLVLGLWMAFLTDLAVIRRLHAALVLAFLARFDRGLATSLFRLVGTEQQRRGEQCAGINRGGQHADQFHGCSFLMGSCWFSGWHRNAS